MSGDRDDWDQDFYDVEGHEKLDREQYLDTDRVVFISLESIKSASQFRVPTAKSGKFETFIAKLLSEYGAVMEDSLYLPVAPNPAKGGEKYTLGYAFAEFRDSDNANECAQQMDGLEKKGIRFRVFPFSHFEEYGDVADEWQKPSMDDFGVKENYDAWLLDKHTRDQFVVRYGEDTEIYWHDPLRRGEREKAYGGERQKADGGVWTDLFCEWSTRGSYLTTFHAPGCAIWGGNDYQKVAKATHFGMEYLDFSPQEHFFVTMRPSDSRNKDEPKAICVWWTQKHGPEGISEKVREFDGGYSIRPDLMGPDGMTYEGAWPIYRWSYDDRYFSRINWKTDQTVIEIVDGFGADRPGTKKKNFKITNLLDFDWSPTQPYLAYTSAEVGNNPATIAIVDMTDDQRKTIALKRLYKVYHPCVIKFSDKDKDRYDFSTRIKWHPQGRYFAALVPRWGGKAKNKKLMYTNFEIFRCAEKEMPVEVLEMQSEVVYKFAWEPNGDRFACIHSKFEVDQRGEYIQREKMISIYSLKTSKEKNQLSLVVSLGKHNTNNRRVTDLFWSPKGRILVMLGKGTRNNGALEFYDVDKRRTLNGGPDLYDKCSHSACNGAEWDPSGRYFATYVTTDLGSVAELLKGNAATQDNGYKLWTFQGDPVSDYKMPLLQFFWRPRPRSLLTEADKKAIKDDLQDQKGQQGSQWEQFATRDEDLKKAGWSKDMAERHRVLDEWTAYRSESRQLAEDIRKRRIEICGFDEDDHGEYQIEDVEEEQVLDYREYRCKDRSRIPPPGAPATNDEDIWESITAAGEKPPMPNLADV